MGAVVDGDDSGFGKIKHLEPGREVGIKDP
jgi:hypothetical protein